MPCYTTATVHFPFSGSVSSQPSDGRPRPEGEPLREIDVGGSRVVVGDSYCGKGYKLS